MGWGGDGDEANFVQWRVSKNTAPTPLPSAGPRKNKNLVGARTDDELTGLIKKTDSRTLVVDYGAPWCEHCKHILPAFVKLTQKFTRPLFVVADVDSVPEVSKDVRYTPTFSFYSRGKKVDEIYGVNRQQLQDHIWLHSD
mmetsp:Transcript_16153/g.35102  ORF Transcript_16153/g.35102 Transcript_16153/m.35102 type:complete len:140 (-) Transcript_16153:322-741(-)|eukprot:CAMPEP_0118928878 /NCGR_PEP_ID=MMETSP1169-20130426/6029_1 /TAXON_ID=36882 /ORGANISM="Pyramimonas obovata, Strain CCMP722" /LENGTH=139 /DNA_ID=CAMNT_0006870955 /DNA_START=84 /DNA_END=503 /DNA_ORIENTATION=-